MCHSSLKCVIVLYWFLSISVTNLLSPRLKVNEYSCASEFLLKTANQCKPLVINDVAWITQRCKGLSCQNVTTWEYDRCTVRKKVVIRFRGGVVNTAELPMLREYEGTPARRAEYLTRHGIAGSRYTFMCYDVIVSTNGLWIVQDDWLPLESGDPDPVDAEWRASIIPLAAEHGYHDFDEPDYDPVSEVWIWFLPALLPP